MNLIIPEPRLFEQTPGMWRVETEIAGQEIYFESQVPLSPRVEAFVCAMMFPAMSRGLNLDVQAPLSPVMMENLRQARVIARQWWPHLYGGEIMAPSAPNRNRATGKGLFFTGGVDSSFALYRLNEEVNELLFVEGFDVELTDEPRLRRVRDSLQAVAGATGHHLAIVRTNLRSHHLFRSLSWETTHIAALAAIAHTLGERFGKVYVADSDVPPPYGSHRDLDGLWSSDSVEIKGFGAGHSRLQRAAAIHDWQPLRGRLRVCWENLAETLNCGFCKKCLLTRLQLLAAGDPTGMDSFPVVPLPEALECIVKTDPGSNYPHFWRETQAALNDVRLRELIDSLLAQNPHPSPTVIKRIKRLLKKLFGLSRKRKKGLPSAYD